MNAQINTYQAKDSKLPLKPSKHTIKVTRPDKSNQFKSIESTELLGRESSAIQQTILQTPALKIDESVDLKHVITPPEGGHGMVKEDSGAQKYKHLRIYGKRSTQSIPANYQ